MECDTEWGIRYRLYDEAAGPHPLHGAQTAASVLRDTLAACGVPPASRLGRLMLRTATRDMLRDLFWWSFLRFYVGGGTGGGDAGKDAAGSGGGGRATGSRRPGRPPHLPLHLCPARHGGTPRTLSHLDRAAAPGTLQHGLSLEDMSLASAPGSPASSSRASTPSAATAPSLSSLVAHPRPPPPGGGSPRFAAGGDAQAAAAALRKQQQEEFVEGEEKDLFTRVSARYVAVLRAMCAMPRAVRDTEHARYADVLAQAVCAALQGALGHEVDDAYKRETLGFVTYWTSGVQRTSISHWRSSSSSGVATDLRPHLPSGTGAGGGRQARPVSGLPQQQQPRGAPQLQPHPPQGGDGSSPPLAAAAAAAQLPAALAQEVEGVAALQAEFRKIKAEAAEAMERKLKCYRVHTRGPSSAREPEVAAAQVQHYGGCEDAGSVTIYGRLRRLKPLPSKVVAMLRDSRVHPPCSAPWFEYGRTRCNRAKQRSARLGSFCTTDCSPFMQHLLLQKLARGHCAPSKPSDMHWSL